MVNALTSTLPSHKNIFMRSIFQLSASILCHFIFALQFHICIEVILRAHPA